MAGVYLSFLMAAACGSSGPGSYNILLLLTLMLQALQPTHTFVSTPSLVSPFDFPVH